MFFTALIDEHLPFVCNQCTVGKTSMSVTSFITRLLRFFSCRHAMVAYAVFQGAVSVAK